ncbi:sporulation related protein [Tepidamorphus gemmatus]|uniref:Sporulation related protein n=1 Tax=Tepidamorphus gemmatus TaxID=747076 RepID=A0A4R3MJ33_9HYPH|nr:SPOR domain-containing protein [Tepidamorphus gemmatus]TCT12542.1 sporulation related protein [Tepidamorphus gemmatus]
MGQAQPKPDKPQRRPGRGRSFRITAIWGAMAAASVAALIHSATSETGRARVAMLFEPRVAVSARDLEAEITRMTTEITRLRSETRLLALEKEALQIKIAALESEIGPLTGSLPDAARESAGASAGSVPAPAAPAADPAARGPSAPEEPGARTPAADVRVGFQSLPLDTRSDDPAAAPSQSDIHEELVSLAHPDARSVPTEISRTRFAVEIGSGVTMSEIRELWRRLSRENRPLIGGLEPAVAIAEQDGGLRLRLLAGPFQNAADAVQLCAVLVGRGVDCRAVPSQGQQLVMQ